MFIVRWLTLYAATNWKRIVRILLSIFNQHPVDFTWESPLSRPGPFSELFHCELRDRKKCPLTIRRNSLKRKLQSEQFWRPLRRPFFISLRLICGKHIFMCFLKTPWIVLLRRVSFNWCYSNRKLPDGNQRSQQHRIFPWLVFEISVRIHALNQKTCGCQLQSQYLFFNKNYTASKISQSPLELVFTWLDGFWGHPYIMSILMNLRLG